MRILPLPALAASLFCCTAVATAQTFSGLGPVRSLVLPPPSGPVQAVEATVAVKPNPGEPALRRLPSVVSPLRVWGENGEIAWTFYATEAEAQAGGRFQVGYLAAISVLPDTSSLTVTINGTVVGTTTIDGAQGLRNVTFEVPPSALSPGYNAVRLSAIQRHRVDCSVAATYELWTQIDPESTGFLLGAQGFGNAADLAAIHVAPDGSTPIRVLQTSDRLSKSEVERLLGALQGVVLAGRIAQPIVDFAPAAEAGDGIAFAVAPAELLAKTIDITSLGNVTGPRLAVLPSSAERRPVLVVTGANEADVTEALSQLARLRATPPQGTVTGLRALSDSAGRRVEGGESFTLADLGFGDARVSARTHRIAFDLALPHDFLSADYDRLVLDLDAIDSAGLAGGAQIVVEINGVNAASAPLGRSRGESLSRRAVFLPLRLLRPGLNRIAITAELPHEDDKACASEANGAFERLRLMATTRLTVPPLARISRQPDLAETLSAGFPYAQATQRPTLSVPAPDRDTMAAAATLVARLGIAAGKPIPFAFAAGRTGIVGPTLVVSPARLLDGPLLATAGVDPRTVQDAWTGRETPTAAQTSSPTARRRALRRDTVSSCRSRPANGSESAVTLSDTGPNFDSASAVLAQGVTGPAFDDLVTLVTAPSAAALREAVDCLVHPRIWNRPQGRLAILSASNGTVASWQHDSPRYVATAAPSPMNLRRIAAGWLSLHAGLYGFFALLIAGSLAGSTQLLVRNLGRRTK